MLDLVGLKRLTAQDPAALTELLEELLRCLKEDLQRLTTLSGDDAPDALDKLAHRIKGPARIVGAQRLIVACEAVEGRSAKEQVQELHLAMQEAIAWTEQAICYASG